MNAFVQERPPGKHPNESPRIPHNLLPQPTPFVGREAELADLEALIADPDVRLITIVGPGGMGKTRLAIAFAERLLQTNHQLTQPSESPIPEYTVSPANPVPDGIYFVPFAPLSSLEEIVPALARALGFQIYSTDGRTPEQQVLDYLREKRMLLILDNLEHLLENVDIIADILHIAPGVQIIVTSWERLQLQQAHVFAIQGLIYLEWETVDEATKSPATLLFLQSARRVQRDFELGASDLPHLYRICRLAQGTPLALELAAAWVDNLSLAGIATEIQHGLDILEAEWRDVPDCHRSMRAALESSWCRLTAAQQQAFAQLCVFRGGFTRAAAQQVARADLHTLATLVNKSLLQFSRSGERYDVHQLLRQYGAEKLAKDPEREAATRDRHSAFYCAALGRWYDDLNRRGEVEETIDINTEWANVRAAWEEAARQAHAARLDRAIGGLRYFILSSARSQDGEALSLARAQRDREDSAQTLVLMGELACFLGEFQAADGYLHESAALRRGMGNRAGLSDCLTDSGAVLWFCGEFDRAHAQLEESQAIAEETDALWVLSFAAAYRAWLDVAAGRYDAARTYAQKAIALYQVGANSFPFAIAQGVLGWAALAEGDYAAAGQTLRNAITAFQEMAMVYASQEYTAWSLAALGGAAYALAKRSEAHAHLFQALQIAVEVRAFIPLVHLVPLIPVVLADEEDVRLKERAVEICAMAESHPFVSKAQLFEDVAGRHIKAATASLPSAVVEAAETRGRALDWWGTARALLVELRELGWAGDRG